MTDDPTTAEELVSAYLDGAATAEEAARVEADPALAARVLELEHVRQRLATEDPPIDLVDEHLAAALAAFDARDDDSASPVTPLAPRRRRRRLHERIPLGAVAAAFVVLALVGAVTQIDLAGDDGSADTAAGDSDDASMESADDGSAGVDETPAGAGDAAEESTTADDEAFTPTSGMIRRAFSDTDALADHARDLLDEHTAAPTTADQAEPYAAPDSRSADPCDVVSLVDADPGTVVLVLPAVVAGREVTALVTESEDRRLRVVDDARCEIIDDRTI